MYFSLIFLPNIRPKIISIIRSKDSNMPIKRETTLIRVNSRCDSLRTTIPKPILDMLGLEEGHKIKWTYSGGKRASIEVLPSNRSNGGGG